MARKQIQTTILSTKRQSNSKNGNPRIVVTTTDGDFRTVVDGSVVYSITNPEYVGEVLLTLDDDRIVGVSTLDGEHVSGAQG